MSAIHCTSARYRTRSERIRRGGACRRVTVQAVRGAGHRFDPAPRKLPSWSSVAAAAGIAPHPEYARQLCGEVRDQGHTSSCVWQAKCRALDMAARIVGVVQPWFSVSFGYRLTRAIARETWRTPLVDDGCFPALAEMVAVGWGLVPESVEPFDPDRINEEPDLMRVVDASSHVQTGEYEILGDRWAGITQALDAGHFPTLAVRVDASFDDCRGEVVGGSSGPDRGHHDVCAISYWGSQLLIVNSWGTDWGDGGFAWLTADRIADPTTRDIYVTTCSPRL